MRTFKGFAGITACVLLALALWDQMVRDPAYRDWHGHVFGIPYDFRRPTIARIRTALWSPDESNIFSPHVLGVGWTLNAGRLYALVVKRVATR
jgi:hypothetical protein